MNIVWKCIASHLLATDEDTGEWVGICPTHPSVAAIELVYLNNIPAVSAEKLPKAKARLSHFLEQLRVLAQ